MNGSIYVIRNTENQKLYIGQTTQTVEKRFKQHLKLLKTNRCQLIHKAIKKYGKDKFYVEVLKTGIETEEELNFEEQRFISEYNTMAPNGYNLCPGGQAWRRHPGTCFKEEEVKEIIRLYELGVSSRDIADRLNTEHRRVLRALHENDVTVRKRSCSLPDRTSKIKLEDIYEYYCRQGLSAEKIAKIINSSASSVRRAIKRYGIKRLQCA